MEISTRCSREICMSKKKILVLAGDYVEDYEIIVPFPRFADGRPHSPRSLPREKKPASLCPLRFTILRGDQTYTEKTAGTILP